MISGARILKTGIAVTISMYICVLLNIEPAIFAGAAAFLNLQPSLGKSFYNALEQILTHFVAIGIAIMLGLTIGGHPLVMGLGTILVILICNRFEWRSSLSGAIMATIFVLASPPDQFLNHAFIRSLAIFIGVGSALLVNITIARPHYEMPLRQKLIALNKFIMAHFNQVVQNYLQLTPPPPQTLKQLNKKAGKFFNEVHDYYGLYKHDLGILDDDGKINRKTKTKFYRDYLNYNRGLWQRTKDIFFLAQDRDKRRKETGNLPPSEDFEEILELINSTLELLNQYNQQLQKKILGATTTYVEEPHIWSKLDQIIKQWQGYHHDKGSDHLHALIEVSLITYKIRWAAKESARLLDFKTNLN